MNRLDRMFSSSDLKAHKRQSTGLKLFLSSGDLRVKAKVWESDSPVMKAVFAPSGDGFACGFASGIVQIFPEQHEIRVEPAVPINDIAWGRKSDFVVFASEGGDIWKWDFKNLELLGEYPFPVTSVCLSPDGSSVITGSDDGVIQVRELERGLLIAEIRENGHTSSISQLGFIAPGGKSKHKQSFLYSTSWDGTIRIWNWQALAGNLPPTVGIIQASVGPICSISYDPAMELFAVSGENGVQLIPFKPDGYNYKVKPSAVENSTFFPTVHDASVRAFRQLFLLGQLDGSIMILDPLKKSLVEFVQGRHYARLTSLSSTTDSSQFLSTSVDGLLKVWPAQLVMENNPDLKPAAWDRKGSSKVTSAKDLVRKIAAPKPETSGEPAKSPIVCAASASYHSASVSVAGREDGRFSVSQTFVLSDKDEKDFEFHMNHFREDQTPEGPLRLGCVAVSPCHNFLATTHEGTLQLWVYHPMKKGAKSPDRFKSITFESPVTAVTFSADEKYIMIGTASLSLTQHLTLTLEEVMDFSFKDESEKATRISGISFSSDGAYLAASTSSGYIKIWKCNNNEYNDLFTPCAVWSSPELLPDLTNNDEPLEEATCLDFGVREDGIFLAAGTSLGHVFVWILTTKELRKHKFSTEIYFATLNANKVRSYVEGSRKPITSLSFTQKAKGLLTTTDTDAKYWNFSHKLEKPAAVFNPLKEFVIVGQKVVNLGQNTDQTKKPDRALLEESVPWHTMSYPRTLTASFSYAKDYIFVSVEEGENALVIEPVSVLPILFWHEFTMRVPGSTAEVSPVIWLAQRKGSIHAVKRMVKDGTESMLYIANELEQVPYLFAVKCGDHSMMKLTSDDGKLDFYKDALGRDAVYFSVFSFTSARMFFQGSTWYTSVDTLGFPAIHYAILYGKEEVVSYILFEVIPKLSTKEQRLVFDSYDAKKRNPMMLLIEKYPVFAKKIMDLFGSRIEPFESGASENLMVLATYNTWLLCPHKGDKKSRQNNSMQLMVHLNRKDLTSHPLTVFVIEKKKWSGFIRRVFMLEFSMQLLIVLILALASVFSNPRLDLGPVYEMIFTGTGWFALRLVIVILALFHMVWQLFVPLRTLIIFRTLDVNYRIISTCAIYIVLIFLILGTINTSSNTSNVAVSIINLLLMMNIISYLPLFPGIGPVVLGVMNTFVPILYWASFFLVVFIAFSVSITTVASDYSARDFSTILTTMLNLFLGMFGDGDVTEILNSGDGLGIVLYYIYLIVVPLILFNILVAMVTEGYTEIEEDKDALWRLNRSKLIIELENSLPSFIKKRYYPLGIEVELEEFKQEKDADKQEQQEQLDRSLDLITDRIKGQKKLLFETLDRQASIEKKHKDAMDKIEAQRQILLDKKLEREKIKQEKEEKEREERERLEEEEREKNKEADPGSPGGPIVVK